MKDVFEIEGTVYRVDQTVEYPSKTGGDPFRKREIILECGHREWEGKKYHEHVKFLATGRQVDNLSVFNTGDKARVSFSLNGRLWTGDDGIEKCFNDVRIVAIQNISATNKPDAQASAEVVENAVDDMADDLPF